MMIATKPGMPVHPAIFHLNALPAIPGVSRYWWNTYTKAQLGKLLAGWRCNEQPPKKGGAIFINLPNGELARVTKSPGSAPQMWAVELFRKPAGTPVA